MLDASVFALDPTPLELVFGICYLEFTTCPLKYGFLRRSGVGGPNPTSILTVPSPYIFSIASKSFSETSALGMHRRTQIEHSEWHALHDGNMKSLGIRKQIKSIPSESYIRERTYALSLQRGNAYGQDLNASAASRTRTDENH